MGQGLSATQQILIQNVTGGTTQSNSWVAYGSTVNNITGDHGLYLRLTAPDK